MEHGHQQIAYTDLAPARIRDHLRFSADFIRDAVESSMVIADYGSAVLLVPFFMKRPYHTLSVCKRTDLSVVHLPRPS